MSDPKHEKVIAVVNSNEDTVEMLRNCLQQHGFSSIVTGHIHDFKTGLSDFPDFVSQHDPRSSSTTSASPTTRTGRSCGCCSTPRRCRGGRS